MWRQYEEGGGPLKRALEQQKWALVCLFQSFCGPVRGHEDDWNAKVGFCMKTRCKWRIFLHNQGFLWRFFFSVETAERGARARWSRLFVYVWQVSVDWKRIHTSMNNKTGLEHIGHTLSHTQMQQMKTQTWTYVYFPIKLAHRNIFLSACNVLKEKWRKYLK